MADAGPWIRLRSRVWEWRWLAHGETSHGFVVNVPFLGCLFVNPPVWVRTRGGKIEVIVSWFRPADPDEES